MNSNWDCLLYSLSVLIGILISGVNMNKTESINPVKENKIADTTWNSSKIGISIDLSI